MIPRITMLHGDLEGAGPRGRFMISVGFVSPTHCDWCLGTLLDMQPLDAESK